MFIVRRIRRGFFSDEAYLEAVKEGVVTKRWLALDRLASWTLKSEQWHIVSHEVLSLRVPKGLWDEGETLTLGEVEAITTNSLKRRKSP